MAQAVAVPAVLAEDRVSAATTPWYVWTFALAVLSVTIGGVWDISWHASIGRDAFLSPPHLLIYLCGILGGFGAAALILTATFQANSPLRPHSIRLWGFRGPLGAFVAAWGAVAMLTSAPFDDWWHNAYGLDVKVLSPPHAVLILGILAIKFGALLIILGELNRAAPAARSTLLGFFLFVGTLLARDLVGVFSFQYLQRPQMHSAQYYLVAMLFLPLGHYAIATASRHRWGLTVLAAVSTAISLSFLWILPLFPAEPKLGPVYREVTHFMPIGGFPMLAIVPCFACDLLRHRFQKLPPWRLSALLGAAMLLGLLAVQWPFAEFLQSPAARNWVFGSHYMPYFTHPNSDFARYVFSAIETSGTQFWTRMGLALLAAIGSTRLGLSLGNWMQRIQR